MRVEIRCDQHMPAYDEWQTMTHFHLSFCVLHSNYFCKLYLDIVMHGENLSSWMYANRLFCHGAWPLVLYDIFSQMWSWESVNRSQHVLCALVCVWKESGGFEWQIWRRGMRLPRRWQHPLWLVCSRIQPSFPNSFQRRGGEWITVSYGFWRMAR